MIRIHCDECTTEFYDAGSGGASHAHAIVGHGGPGLPLGWSKVSRIGQVGERTMKSIPGLGNIELPESAGEMPKIPAHAEWSREIVLCHKCSEARFAGLTFEPHAHDELGVFA